MLGNESAGLFSAGFKGLQARSSVSKILLGNLNPQT